MTLTIELSEDAANAARARARLANLTLEEWAAARIGGCHRDPGMPRDAMGYPIGWFERTEGVLADVEDLREPEDRPSAAVGGVEL
ncbi:MAG: hypothetical protein ABI680_13225 [Chthoniobacteraceae bacterium]